jgi:hypothetical protein
MKIVSRFLEYCKDADDQTFIKFETIKTTSSYLLKRNMFDTEDEATKQSNILQ